MGVKLKDISAWEVAGTTNVPMDQNPTRSKNLIALENCPIIKYSP